MSFKPQRLLSVISRERFVAKLKEIPALLYTDTEHNKFASVLLPLCIVDGEVSLLYTLRSSSLKNHSGQVSFPGGKRDEAETTIETALRETEEEIGFPRSEIDVWGEMPPIQGRDKNLLITPVVGLLNNFEYSNLKQNYAEVEEIFTVPVKSLCDKNNRGYFQFKEVQLPVYLYETHKIWGITGLITHLFLQCFISSDVYNNNLNGKKYEFKELLRSNL